jgi:putative AdoMet-dependent methyltransferase
MTTPDPFPASEFDDWAGRYDQSVQDQETFPFEGYNQVLGTIYRLAGVFPGQSVLDLGIGTGNLALLFAQNGCRLTGTDFSGAMLNLAREKMPTGEFHLHDLRQPLPFGERRFDAIVSAYVFHHFPLDQKAEICARLIRESLAPQGCLLIGDISFPTLNDKIAYQKTIPDWEDEFYWLADESLQALQDAQLSARYLQISACAGIYEIHPARKSS